MIHIDAKNIGDNICFFMIINEEFQHSILSELKQPKNHLAVYPHELQDGRYRLF